MKIIIGVRFRQAGKIYYFDPGKEKENITRGTRVIVETAKGVEMGTVVLPPTEMPEEKIVAPLKGIVRLATKEDEDHKQKIAKHKLEMKLIAAEYTFDRNKLLFYFTADGRIDFRELVKDLASVFRTRIELRQIGVRDETKLRGGIGICGRALCCHTYLSEFAPVSIKMAKEQNLSLNPTKISGVCGRLMCCLKNEEEAYEELNRSLPNVGTRVKTPDGLNGEVQNVSVLKQKVRVIVTLDNDEKEVREYMAAELKFRKERKRDHGKHEDDKELKALEAMEKKEGKSKI